MKRFILLGSLVAFLGVSPAFAKDTCKGEVTSVQGNEVTIKVKDAKGLKAGDKVEVELKGKKEESEAPKMMMGC
jgi:ribosomal 50S subunit-recycling heat shock protein